jgi:Flp pilus assembly protein TadG
MNQFNKKWLRERGASIVELAVIMTAMLLMVLGVIDLGRALYIKVEVANAAHAGALYGAQSTQTAADSTGITYAIQHEAADLGTSIVGISTNNYCQCLGGGTVTCGTGTCPTGVPLIEWLTVTCHVVYSPWFKIPYFGLPTSYLIQDSATMPVSGL